MRNKIEKQKVLSTQYLVLRKSRGFTLVELVVATAIFGIILAGVLGSYSALTSSVKVAREKTILSSLSANYLEIVRNLPYSEVGTVNGNPPGSLADQSNPIIVSIASVVYHIYYEVTYIDDTADGTIVLGSDPAPNDYKQVKMFIKNTKTNQITNFLSNISPKGLEGLTSGGALLLNVFNASGQPVSGANVHIENTLLNPDIILDRQTNSSGQVIEVALPPSVNGYHVVVTKTGYSSDQTEPISVGNPNPTKPDATVVNGVVTSVSFGIDLLSNLTIRTLNQLCQNVNGVNVNIKGAKLIGTNPNVLKFDNSFVSSSGQVVLNNIEWDTYTPTLVAGQSYVIYGTSPIQQITVLPATSQTYTMILGQPSTSYSLLVIVKDAATGTALEGAVVHLRKGGSTPQDYYGTTGGSVWKQIDWTAGNGQTDYVSTDRYFADDGNIDINSMPTGVRLKKVTGQYVFSGWLESSTFDTGGSSNFTIISWEPTSQDPAATLKFQIATNNDNLTWNYKGPDGTAGTFYTVPGTSMSAVHDNDRYVRYKMFLSTTNDKKTPIATSVHTNYVSGCFTPGQVMFPDLTNGNNYDLDITLAGYQTQVINSLDINSHQVLEVLMSP